MLALTGTIRADTTAQQRFFEACSAGDAVRTLAALEDGAEINRLDGDGHSGLMLAARSGDFDTVKVLLWRGAPAGQKDAASKLALDYARGIHPTELAAGESLKATPDYLITILLRCYAYVQANCSQSSKVRQKPLVLLNEPTVDYTHEKIAPYYYLNEAEKRGYPNVDDDHNGFVDDIYGWSTDTNTPHMMSEAQLQSYKRNHDYLQRLFGRFNDAKLAGSKAIQTLYADLDQHYTNPLESEFGGRQYSDLKYLQKMRDLSHGVHCAGIIINNSHNKARLHTLSWGFFGGESPYLTDQNDAVETIGREAPNFAAFYKAFLDRLREDSVMKGKVMSNYVRVTGAGVVNMSMGFNTPNIKAHALQILKAYTELKEDAFEGLSEEQAKAMVSEFELNYICYLILPYAVMVYENPDVLFVAAAGNGDNEGVGYDNDETFDAPANLSRFFPNLMTIASVNGKGELSPFSQFGQRSVNLAALGEMVRSTAVSNLEVIMDGTSMATPAVAGVAAELRSLHPNLTAGQLRELLEYSGDPAESLAEKLTSSAVLNGAKAIAFADGGPNAALAAARYHAQRGAFKTALAEIDTALAASRDEALVAERTRILEEMRAPVAASKSAAPTGFELPTVADQSEAVDWAKTWDWVKKHGELGYRVTSLGGYAGHWSIVMSKGSPLKQQSILGPDKDFPETDIAGLWKKGLEITAIAGDEDGWLVAMSSGAKLGTQKFSMIGEWPANFVKKNWSNYAITSMAGFDKTWLVVMSAGTKDQQYKGPGDWPREFIKARWDENYLISAVAGTTGANHEHWNVLMTKTGETANQYYTAEGNFPAKAVTEYWAKDYRIIAVSGYPKKWRVVLATGSGFADQVVW